MQSLLQRLLLGNAGGGGGGNPTLNYNFVDGSAFPSAITFTRGSNATQFDSSGNLVYAPANLLLQSEAFNTTWTTSNASIAANSTTAPSGTTTADTLVEDNATNFHFVQQTVSGTSNLSTYTLSCFIKASTRTAARIAIIEGTTFSRQVRATVDLSAGTVVGTALNSATLTAATITPVGDSWYRVTVAGVLGGTDTNILCAVYVGQDPATFNYAGNGTSGVFIWGAQLNFTNMLGGVTASLSTYYPTTTTAYYGPRLDYNPSTLAPQGFLVEEQRTNSIRNNTMQGAVAGTPGTLPTNWNVGGLGTLTQTVVGTGTQNGINYIDVRFNGTTSTTQLTVRFEQTGIIAAANGQSWALSSWVSFVAGSLTNISSPTLSNNLFDAGSVYLGDGPSNTFTLTSTFTRYTAAGAIATALTASIRPYFYVTFASGVAIDITLRIGLPQLEQGAFATSVIPTTTTALTRSADVASVNTLSPWFNSVSGTFYTEVLFGSSAATNTGVISAYESSAFANNRISIRVGNTIITSAGVQVANFFPTGTANTVAKYATAYQLNDFAQSVNGGAPATDTSGAVPANINEIKLGGVEGTTSFALNGYLRQIRYYPVRLTNAALQQITT